MAKAETRPEPVEKALTAILNAKPIDWDAFDAKLMEYENINALSEGNEDTALTNFINYYEFYHNGELMSEVIRHFLRCGYDVSANNGKNGILALRALCWSSYDRYVLDAARVLLQAGALTGMPDSEIVNTGKENVSEVLDSILWRISGAWTPDRDYLVANVFEAFYCMVKAYEAGKEDYASVETMFFCIGKTLTDVCFVGEDGLTPPRAPGDVYHFSGSLIFRFSDRPLVVSRYLDMVVNPLEAEEYKTELHPAEGALSTFIGCRLRQIEYLNSNVCYLEFDNGQRILFTNHADKDRKRVGMFEIAEAADYAPDALHVDAVFKAKGSVYSSSCNEYDEPTLALSDGSSTYILHTPDTETEHRYLKCLKCSAAFAAAYCEKLPVSVIGDPKCCRDDQGIRAMRYPCGAGYLYVQASSYGKGVIFCLSTAKLAPEANIGYDESRLLHMGFVVQKK